jgi:hypothetical protein
MRILNLIGKIVVIVVIVLFTFLQHVLTGSNSQNSNYNNHE